MMQEHPQPRKPVGLRATDDFEDQLFNCVIAWATLADPEAMGTRTNARLKVNGMLVRSTALAQEFHDMSDETLFKVVDQSLLLIRLAELNHICFERDTMRAPHTLDIPEYDAESDSCPAQLLDAMLHDKNFPKDMKEAVAKLVPKLDAHDSHLAELIFNKRLDRFIDRLRKQRKIDGPEISPP